MYLTVYLFSNDLDNTIIAIVMKGHNYIIISNYAKNHCSVIIVYTVLTMQILCFTLGIPNDYFTGVA